MALIAERLPQPPSGQIWSGDDAALVSGLEERALITVDALVEGVDLDTSYCAPADIGWKALAVNVSDIAAMGGRPRHAVTFLGLPDATTVGWIDGFLEGLTEAARRWQIDLVGGDISSAPQLCVSITLTGDASGPVVRRSGARAGDALCVTGTLGGSAGGLELLRGGHPSTDHAAAALAARHLRPQARSAEGVELARCGASAMIDVSDGLALDLKRLLVASGVGAVVDPAALPVDPALSYLRSLPGAPSPLELALRGGEDFELLFTVPPAALEEALGALERVGGRATQIGEVRAGPRMLGDIDLDQEEDLGWDHLRNR